MTHTHLVRRRHAWVGVTAQRAGLEGGGLVDNGMHLKKLFPDQELTAVAKEDPLTLCAGRLLELLGCTNHELADHPWYAPREVRVPWVAEAGDLAIAGNMLEGAMAAAKTRTVCMRTAIQNVHHRDRKKIRARVRRVAR